MTERITIVEIDVSRCTLTYGLSPCTAAVGVTGERKCFNSFATCQDQANYDREDVTVRHSSVSGDLPLDIDTIPDLASIDARPAKVELGESIGIRASATIVFMDARSPDTGADGDKYLDERPYDPYKTGTYWGKFRARQPYLKGQPLRIIRGSSDQSIDQMEIRHFIVDRMSGPDSSGKFTIQAKDVLRLASGDQAQAPKLSQGFLDAAISAGAGALVLSPAGIGNIDYPSSGKAQIGGAETVTFTRVGDNVTLTGRGLNGSTAIAHDDEDRFQICLEYVSQKVTAIINDLLVNYAGVSTDFIPLAAWTSEDDTYIARLYSGIVAEPFAVSALINELLAQTASNIWWDDLTQLIPFRVLRAVSDDAALYSDDVISAGSFSAVDQPDKRISQVWTYYGQINPLESLTDRKNYRSTLVTVDLGSETNFNNVPAIKQIYSRWIPAFARDAASRLNSLLLSRYATPPRMLAWTVQRDPSLISPELVGGYQLEHFTLQIDTGEPQTIGVQTVQVKAGDTHFAVMAEEVLYLSTVAPEDPNFRPISIDTSANNLNLRDIYDAQFPAPDANTTIVFTVEAGVTVGSASVGALGIDTGEWPENPLLIQIKNFGRMQGKGGAGGKGGTDTVNGVAGQNGGDALIVRHDIELDNEFGEIWSGGGGGGGSGGATAQAIAVVIFSISPPFTFAYNVFASSGGGGGGAGAGATSSAGGVGEDPRALPIIYRDAQALKGKTGQASSSAVAGNGGANVLTQASFSGVGTISLSAQAQSKAGGNGGGPGLNGSAGQNASATASATGGAGLSTSLSTEETASNGGAGGVAGDAIVQSGGTVTILNTGDIRGAIV